MAFDEMKYRALAHGGLSHGAAALLADPATDIINGAAVATPAAMTTIADIPTTYSEVEVQHLRDDVAALRTTVVNLLTSLRDAGVIVT